jgi:hypothetical protein
MSTIKQHLPPFITGMDRVVASFDTLDDLLAIPFVAKFARGPGFRRFSLGPYVDTVMLLAEYDGGVRWWVVGYISGDPPDLPAWR